MFDGSPDLDAICRFTSFEPAVGFITSQRAATGNRRSGCPCRGAIPLDLTPAVGVGTWELGAGENRWSGSACRGGSQDLSSFDRGLTALRSSTWCASILGTSLDTWRRRAGGKPPDPPAISDDFARIMGRLPRTLDQFLEANRTAWTA